MSIVYLIGSVLMGWMFLLRSNPKQTTLIVRHQCFFFFAQLPLQSLYTPAYSICWPNRRGKSLSFPGVITRKERKQHHPRIELHPPNSFSNAITRYCVPCFGFFV